MRRVRHTEKVNQERSRSIKKFRLHKIQDTLVHKNLSQKNGDSSQPINVGTIFGTGSMIEVMLKERGALVEKYYSSWVTIVLVQFRASSKSERFDEYKV